MLGKRKLDTKSNMPDTVIELHWMQIQSPYAGVEHCFGNEAQPSIRGEPCVFDDGKIVYLGTILKREDSTVLTKMEGWDKCARLKLREKVDDLPVRDDEELQDESTCIQIPIAHTLVAN